MTEDRMARVLADDLDARLARYLDWESAQLPGTPSGEEIAVQIGRNPVQRRWIGNAVLAWAVLAMALLAALAFVVTGGSNLLSVLPSASPQASAGDPAPILPTSPPPATPRPGEPTFSLGPDPSSCTQFDHEATYTARAGTLPVSITVPATTSSLWAGLADEFELLNAPCAGSGPVWINAVLVAHVYADSCHWKSSSVEAPTAVDVVSQLQAQEGHDASAATDTKVGYFRATRLDLSVPADFDATTCDDGVLGLWETSAGMRIIVPGTTIQIYVAEVDGSTLVVTAGYRPEDATPDLLAEIDSMLATLRVDF
jgi:hypothetical protein